MYQDTFARDLFALHSSTGEKAWKKEKFGDLSRLIAAFTSSYSQAWRIRTTV